MILRIKNFVKAQGSQQRDWPWRKLYRIEQGRFACLPLRARMLAGYLIKFCDGDGRLDCGNETMVTAIGQMIRAEQHERKWLGRALDDLLKEGYLVVERSVDELLQEDFPGAEPAGTHTGRTQDGLRTHPGRTQDTPRTDSGRTQDTHETHSGHHLKVTPENPWPENVGHAPSGEKKREDKRREEKMGDAEPVPRSAATDASGLVEPLAPSEPARPKKPSTRPRKAWDIEGTDQHALKAKFTELYAAKNNAAPTWGRDQAFLVEDLLKSQKLPEILRRAAVAFSAPPAFLAGTPMDLRTFVKHFDLFAAPATRASQAMPPRDVRLGPVPADNTLARAGGEVKL